MLPQVVTILTSTAKVLGLIVCKKIFYFKISQGFHHSKC
jgi:hypothetical protein